MGLILACITKMIAIQIPNMIILLALHTVVYQATGISIYNKFKTNFFRWGDKCDNWGNKKRGTK